MAIHHRVRTARNLAHAVNAASQPGSPSLWTRLRAVPRMIRAVRSGQYQGLSSTKAMMMIAGLGYVLSPVDLVPEGLLLVLGLADDALVLSWLAVTLVQETEAFLAWEQGSAAYGQPAAAHAWADTSGPGAFTVPSEVVRD